GQQHRARRAQRDQTMLIKRQLVRLLVKFLELAVKPVGETSVDLFDRLSNLAAARRGAAAARLQWNGQGDAFIEGSGQQRGLAVARMTDDRDAPGINVL